MQGSALADMSKVHYIFCHHIGVLRYCTPASDARPHLAPLVECIGHVIMLFGPCLLLVEVLHNISTNFRNGMQPGVTSCDCVNQNGYQDHYRDWHRVKLHRQRLCLQHLLKLQGCLISTCQYLEGMRNEADDRRHESKRCVQNSR